jgi:uncharacterized integral membrane protein (TIGR00697 family)
MNQAAQTSPRSLLIPIILFHLVVIAVSNYLVQIPVNVFGLQTTWGAFTFPLIFLATDLTVRIYGASQARRIIFSAMLPALLISYVLSVLFYEAKFQGYEQLSVLNTFVGRIAIASFIAYTVGQLLDITVFNKLRQKKNWWIAPASSSVIGGLIDTLLFFSIAFYQSSDEFLAANWQEIAAVDYGFKLIISMALFVPAYGVLMNTFSKRLTPA